MFARMQKIRQQYGRKQEPPCECSAFSGKRKPTRFEAEGLLRDTKTLLRSSLPWDLRGWRGECRREVEEDTCPQQSLGLLAGVEQSGAEASTCVEDEEATALPSGCKD